MGMMIKRYDKVARDSLEECSSGDFVSYADYESLEEDFKVLQRDYQKLVDKIGDIYREA